MLSILLFKLACFSGNVFKCDYVTIIEMITVFVSDNTYLKKSLIVVYSFTSYTSFISFIVAFAYHPLQGISK